MITITVYGGARSIGGNKILLEDGQTRLFFDFGMSFKVREQYFEEYLKPRPGAGLLDLLEMQYTNDQGIFFGPLLPRIEGIYRHDLIPPGGVWERYREHPGYAAIDHVDAVLVSHAHIDHTGYISFLREDIPIFSTAMTAFIAKSMQDSGLPELEKEVCYFAPREPHPDYDIIKSSNWQKNPYVLRPFVLVDGEGLSAEAKAFWKRKPGTGRNLSCRETDAEPNRVGGLQARHWPVDHSVHGACAWAVETSAGWVVYTGDLRLHGSRGDMTRRFIAEAKALRPRVLICEGTRAGAARGQDEQIGEDEVRANVLEEVKSTDGLVVADFGPRNVERLCTFLEVARATNRKLVILAKDAFLLDKMRLASDEVPTMADTPELLIYRDLKAAPQHWELTLRDRYGSRLVTGPDIKASGGDFIVCFSFWDVKNLIDMEPRGGKYIYSSSESYSEEQDIDFRRLHNWLQHFGMEGKGLPYRDDATRERGLEHPGLHASGHATAGDLLELIQEIAPQSMVSIHTESPGYFVEGLKGSGIEVIVPEYAERLEIA
ncbi:MAG TPA: MBL fold metallo-hydrolase [Dehalococcoidia bacterium]|nr:MBL fold metallo-hydrolase [Dehalococcoidia bacterium]